MSSARTIPVHYVRQLERRLRALRRALTRECSIDPIVQLDEAWTEFVTNCTSVTIEAEDIPAPAEHPEHIHGLLPAPVFRAHYYRHLFTEKTPKVGKRG